MPEKLINYYHVLGLEQADNPNESAIKRAYRQQALKHHPDKNNGNETEKFKEAKEAFDVLSDPAKRQAHDELLRKNPLLTITDLEDVVVFDLGDQFGTKDGVVGGGDSIAPYKAPPHTSLGTLMRNADMSAQSIIQLAVSNPNLGLHLLNMPSFISRYESQVFVGLVFKLYAIIKSDPLLLQRFNSSKVVGALFQNLPAYLNDLLAAGQSNVSMLAELLDEHNPDLTSLDKMQLIRLSQYYTRAVSVLFESPYVNTLELTEVNYIIKNLDIQTQKRFEQQYSSAHGYDDNEWFIIRFLQGGSGKANSANIELFRMAANAVGIKRTLELVELCGGCGFSCWNMLVSFFDLEAITPFLLSHHKIILPSFLQSVKASSYSARWASFLSGPDSANEKMKRVEQADGDLRILLQILERYEGHIEYIVDLIIEGNVKFCGSEKNILDRILEKIVCSQKFLEGLNRNDECTLDFCKKHKLWPLILRNAELTRLSLSKHAWTALLKDDVKNIDLSDFPHLGERLCDHIRAMQTISLLGQYSVKAEDFAFNQVDQFINRLDSSGLCLVDGKLNLSTNLYKQLFNITGFYSDLTCVEVGPETASHVIAHVLANLGEYQGEAYWLKLFLRKILPAGLKVSDASSENIMDAIFDAWEGGFDFYSVLVDDIVSSLPKVYLPVLLLLFEHHKSRCLRLLTNEQLATIEQYLKGDSYKQHLLSNLTQDTGEEHKLSDYADDNLFKECILLHSQNDSYAHHLNFRAYRVFMTDPQIRNKIAGLQQLEEAFGKASLQAMGDKPDFDCMLSKMLDGNVLVAPIKLLKQGYEHNPAYILSLVNRLLADNTLRMNAAQKQQLAALKSRAEVDGVALEEVYLCDAVQYIVHHQDTIAGDKLQQLASKFGTCIVEHLTPRMKSKLRMVNRATVLVGDERSQFGSVVIDSHEMNTDCIQDLARLLKKKINHAEAVSALPAIYDKLLEIPAEDRSDMVEIVVAACIWGCW